MYRRIPIALAIVVATVIPLAASGLRTSAGVSFPVTGLIVSKQGGPVTETGVLSSQDPDQFYLFVGSAAAGSGFLSKGTSAQAFTMDLLSIGFLSGPEADATAESFDVVTPGTSAPFSSGFLALQFLVTGSNFGLLTGDPNQNNSVGSSVSGQDTRIGGCVASADQANPFQPDCNVDFVVFDAIDYEHFPVELRFPVVFGLPVELYLFQFSRAGALFQPGLLVNYNGASMFADTSTLSSVSLLDEDGNPVPNPTLVSESGTIYPLSAPTTSPGPVPEPSSLIFITSGLAMGAIGRKRLFRGH